MSSNREKIESAIRLSIGKRQPNMTREASEQALHRVKRWCTFDPSNRQLYKELEADAEVGWGQEKWRDRIDHMVAMALGKPEKA
jgi:hypothetical protein